MENKIKKNTTHKLSLWSDISQVFSGMLALITFAYFLIDRQKEPPHHDTQMSGSQSFFIFYVATGLAAFAYFLFITIWRIRKVNKIQREQAEQIFLIKACISGYLENARKTNIVNNFNGTPSTINDADRFYQFVEREVKRKWEKEMLTPEIESKVQSFYQDIAV
jgi:hypothetical protein